MRIHKNTIEYVKMLCNLLPKTLNEINTDYDNCDGYLFQSEARARFNRLRIELTKYLGKIKEDIYK